MKKSPPPDGQPDNPARFGSIGHRSVLPSVWCIVLGAMAVGCGEPDADEPAPSPPPSAAATDPEQTVPPPASDEPAIIAPLFVHGTGRGTVGRPGADPPSFLTDAEAIAIIADEFALHGVEFPEREVTLADVRIAPRVRKAGRGASRSAIVDGEPAPLVVDLHDGVRRIAVEFVSVDDHDELGGVRTTALAQVYDLKEVARHIGEQAGASAHGLHFAVLYDPVTARVIPAEARSLDPYEALRAARRAAIAESERLLRAQVRDLVQWLRDEGAIRP